MIGADRAHDGGCVDTGLRAARVHSADPPLSLEAPICCGHFGEFLCAAKDCVLAWLIVRPLVSGCSTGFFASGWVGVRSVRRSSADCGRMCCRTASSMVFPMAAPTSTGHRCRCCVS